MDSRFFFPVGKRPLRSPSLSVANSLKALCFKVQLSFSVRSGFLERDPWLFGGKLLQVWVRLKGVRVHMGCIKSK